MRAPAATGTPVSGRARRAAATRQQRRRATRSSEAPQQRVDTQTVVRRTQRDADGNFVKTTQRDRAINPLVDESPRPATPAEMAALLRAPKQLAPEAAPAPQGSASQRAAALPVVRTAGADTGR